MGRHCDRTTAAALYGYDRDGLAVTNHSQPRHTALSDGNADRAKLISQGVRNPGEQPSAVALGVGPTCFTPDVGQAVPELPLYWIESGTIEDFKQAMALVADLVASVERLRRDRNVQDLVLFWTTANHVALLAAANLTSHVIAKIKFMEWDHAKAEYVHLPMP